MYELGKDQKNALQGINEFIESKDDVFVLSGGAGTGKTSILSVMMDENAERGFSLLAPTGRAAAVINQKTKVEAYTIHSFIYELQYITPFDEKNADDTAQKSFFSLRENDLPRGEIIIVDEASMISNRTQKNENLIFGTGNLLRDLISYVRFDRGQKIIFVGDAYQLPPVGDNKSVAMLAPLLASIYKLEVRSAMLLKVYRQTHESSVLSFANAIRNNISTDNYSQLALPSSQSTRKISSTALVDDFVIKHKEDEGENICIAYSNKLVCEYNSQIRRKLFPCIDEPIMPQDRLMCVRNYNFNDALIFNGEMFSIISIDSPVETKKCFLKTKTSNQSYNFSFVDVSVQMASDRTKIYKLKLNISLLDSFSPQLSGEEYKALYINSIIEIKRNKGNEFIPECEVYEALRQDAYYNAMHVKYAYAITCHKSQGGQWDNVYVDFQLQNCATEASSRWAYTAVSRSSQMLSCVNLPEYNTFSKILFSNIESINKKSGVYFVLQNTDDVANQLKQFLDNIMPSEYTYTINERPYLCMVDFCVGNQNARFNFYYNGKGEMKDPACPKPTKYTDIILKLLMQNDKNNKTTEDKFIYRSEISSLNSLYDKILSLSQLCIVGIKENSDSYYVDYQFSEMDESSFIRFYFNAKGFVSRCTPYSPKGKDDLEVKNIVDVLKKYLS